MFSDSIPKTSNFFPLLGFHSQNLKPEASEMPHHAKHHASENRRAIERSLVTRTKNVSSLGEGRLWSRLDATTTDRLRRSYFAYIAITKPRTCMVFRII